MGGRFISILSTNYLMSNNSVIEDFIKSMVGGGIGGNIVNEVIKISYSVVSVIVYGIASTMRRDNGVRLSLVASLSRVFRADFLRDVFNVLIASFGDGDDVIDAAGMVAEAFLLKTLYGNEEGGVKPTFLNPIKVEHKVYMVVYNELKSYVDDVEYRNGIAFGFFGNVIITLLTVITLLMIIGMCQGLRSEGYPDGIRDFLNYALTQGTHMALSEMLSHG
jgi:hypothetical protein|nr:MAG: hypothetical protein TU36_08140 [Vulcanisaeta sp. AZ3]